MEVIECGQSTKIAATLNRLRKRRHAWVEGGGVCCAPATGSPYSGADIFQLQLDVLVPWCELPACMLVKRIATLRGTSGYAPLLACPVSRYRVHTSGRSSVILSNRSIYAHIRGYHGASSAIMKYRLLMEPYTLCLQIDIIRHVVSRVWIRRNTPTTYSYFSVGHLGVTTQRTCGRPSFWSYFFLIFDVRAFRQIAF